jgi:hypothetical protein
MKHTLLIITAVMLVVGCSNKNKVEKHISKVVEEEKQSREIIKEKYTDFGTFYQYYKNPDDKHYYKSILYFGNGNIESESYYNNGKLDVSYMYFKSGQLAGLNTLRNGVYTLKVYYEDEIISSIRRERMKQSNSTELMNFDHRKNRIRQVRQYKGDILISDVVYSKSGNVISRR